MKDNDFKNLLHNADGYEIISRGLEIVKGYKPDVVLKQGDQYIIMECDTGTTRKGYIGAMIKAAKFLSGEKKGIAVFVIKEKKNTTVKQIHAHLRPYFEWIEPLTNLLAIYLISTDLYCTIDTPLELLEIAFLKEAKIIERYSKLNTDSTIKN